MSDVFRVLQLSDTHFLEAGAEPEGGHGYDTWAAFEAVRDHASAGADHDLVVVTGDIADHGLAQEYLVASAAFRHLAAPVHATPGNHDFDEPLRRGFDGADVTFPRVTSHGNWAFVYVDSNAGGMVVGADGTLSDPPGEDRLHRNGTLGEREATWVVDTVRSTDAEHVFIWLHHPPDPDAPLSADDDYAAEWTALMPELDRVRGFGGGHTHVPATYEFAGRPVFVSPSLKNNFDLVADTWLPPGYRSYEFRSDGQVTSDVHLVDDERWPRRPMGRAVRALLHGELTYAELEAIAARKAAERRPA